MLIDATIRGGNERMSHIIVDRHSPTRRPEGLPVMYQCWNKLLFLHWQVDAVALAKLLPPGLTLDTFEGTAYVGLVPFTMSGIRPRGLPAVSWLSNFHETNVRTYVLDGNADPGVWFFSLEAANPIAVGIARSWFHLPYYYSRMSVSEDAQGWLTYDCERRYSRANAAGCHVVARPTGETEPARLGTLEHFLAERYILYSLRRGRLAKGRVHHASYPLQRAEVVEVEENLLNVAKIVRPDTTPLAHYAAGVSVEVFALNDVIEGTMS